MNFVSFEPKRANPNCRKAIQKLETDEEESSLALVVLAIILATGLLPLWPAVVIAMLLIGAVVSNNDIGFDSDSDDDDDDDDDYDFD